MHTYMGRERTRSGHKGRSIALLYIVRIRIVPCLASFETRQAPGTVRTNSAFMHKELRLVCLQTCYSGLHFPALLALQERLLDILCLKTELRFICLWLPCWASCYHYRHYMLV